MDAVFQGAHVHGQLDPGVLGLLSASAAAVHFHGMALDDVGDGLGLLTGLLQRVAVLFRLRLGGIQLLCRRGQIPLQRGAALPGSIHRGLEGAQLHPRLGGGGQGQRLTGLEGRGLLGGGVGVPGDLPHLREQRVDLALQCG